MVVEVIGIDQSKYKETTCHNCASRLRYTFYDVNKYLHRDYTGCTDTLYYINCPACRHEVVVRR